MSSMENGAVPSGWGDDTPQRRTEQINKTLEKEKREKSWKKPKQ